MMDHEKNYFSIGIVFIGKSVGSGVWVWLSAGLGTVR